MKTDKYDACVIPFTREAQTAAKPVPPNCVCSACWPKWQPATTYDAKGFPVCQSCAANPDHKLMLPRGLMS